MKLIQTSYIKHLPSYALITEFSKSHEEIESITYIHALWSYKDHLYKDQVVQFRKNKDQY